MATISGRVIFDRDRSASISTGDLGLSNIPVVLQNVSTSARLVVLTDAEGNYSFRNVPNGSYRIVESYGATGGVPTPGDFLEAVPGSVPQGVNPPITSAPNPAAGSTNLDSVTPDTLLVTVSGSDIANENFFNGPVIYTPIQTILDPCALISGENLINAADGGTFGSFPQGTPANTGAPVEPYPGVAPDFTYVLPNPAVYAPFGGEYTVQNIMNNSMSAQIGAWWRIADHTTGTETGRMMIVNGDRPGSVFFRDVIAVRPNTRYLFSSWILNLFRVSGYPDPQLGVRVTDEDSNVLYSATLGAEIPVNTNAPEWKQIGSVINSRNNTSLVIEFLSEGPEVIGNDYAIDDISFREIEVPEFTPVKSVDRSSVNVGDTVTFTVTLTNSCQSPLTDVSFRDELPNGLVFVPGSVTISGVTAPAANPELGFALPDIPGGATAKVVFQARADAVPTPNPVQNSADMVYFYTPVEGGIPGEYDVSSNEVPVEVETLADVSVQKTASPSPAQPGGTLTYTVVVQNAGPSPAAQVELKDDVPKELSNVEYSVNGGASFQPWTGSYQLGTLDAGERRTILIRGVLSPSASGEVENTAVVSSSTPDPDPENNTSEVVVPVEPSADLSVVKTASPNPVAVGEVLTYLVQVSNAGPSAAVNVNLRDTVPGELDNPEISTDGGAQWSPYNGEYFIGNLAPGASRQILIRGLVSSRASQSLTNTATVSSGTPDPNPDNNTDTAVTPIQGNSDLVLRKTACPNPVSRRQCLTYTLTVTNAGADTASQVRITDELPSVLTRQMFSVDHGRTWRPWRGSFLLGELPPGASFCILLSGVVCSCAGCFITNQATVTSASDDANPSDNTASVTVAVRDCLCGRASQEPEQ